MILGYIRVSKRDQNTGRQDKALKDVCDEVVVEKLSAVAAKRPGFDSAIERLQKGDTFVVLDIDRGFRSTVDAITTAEKLHNKGVHLKILNTPIDTTTEWGEMIFTIIAAFAQAERKMTKRRTLEGLAAARERGKRPGRPPKLTRAQVNLARRSIEGKVETISGMAEILGVDRKTLRRALKSVSAANESAEA